MCISHLIVRYCHILNEWYIKIKPQWINNLEPLSSWFQHVFYSCLESRTLLWHLQWSKTQAKSPRFRAVFFFPIFSLSQYYLMNIRWLVFYFAQIEIKRIDVCVLWRTDHVIFLICLHHCMETLGSCLCSPRYL